MILKNDLQKFYIGNKTKDNKLIMYTFIYFN